MDSVSNDTEGHPKGCTCRTCVMIDSAVRRGILKPVGKQIQKFTVTQQFMERVKENADKELASEMPSDEQGMKDLIGRACFLTVMEYCTKERDSVDEKEVVDITAMVAGLLDLLPKGEQK